MLVLVGPFSPALITLVFAVCWAAGKQAQEARWHHLSKLSALLAGLWTAPLQLVLYSAWYLTGVLPVPWAGNNIYCDHLGRNVKVSHSSQTFGILKCQSSKPEGRLTPK